MNDVKKFLLDKAQRLQKDATDLNLSMETMAKELMTLDADLKQVGKMLEVLNPPKKPTGSNG